MNTRISGWMLAACLGLVSSAVHAQQRFELVVPGSDVVSQASRTATQLRIVDSSGQETVYQRDMKYDTEDGLFLGYFSSAAKQAIRWPANNRGRMEIASAVSPGLLVFRPSRMEIRPSAPMPGLIEIADIDPKSCYRMTTSAAADQGQATSVEPDGSVVLRTERDEDNQHWHFAPLGQGVFRIHSDLRGRQWSLAAKPGNDPRLEPTANVIHQLWQVAAIPGQPGVFAVANCAAPWNGKVLTCGPGVPFAMRPRKLGINQQWRFVWVGGRFPPVFTQYQFVSREIRPNPPLEPAQVELVNSHSKELWVLVADQQDPTKSMRLKIPAGKSTTVSLNRDAGATLVEIYERGLRNGGVQREELVTPLPPFVRYDVSVYELIVQSIAIDRTVPGGKLEDVQYSPRSTGWFELAPGPELSDGPIDVFEVAKSQENAGQVRRIDPAQWQPKGNTSDPVESILEKFQPKK